MLHKYDVERMWQWSNTDNDQRNFQNLKKTPNTNTHVPLWIGHDFDCLKLKTMSDRVQYYSMLNQVRISKAQKYSSSPEEISSPLCAPIKYKVHYFPIRTLRRSLTVGHSFERSIHCE